jgi:1-acyl-sn-glycerol-3-phosphate acyltransferase
MLERAWRVLATGVCFASFGAGGVLIGLFGPLVLRGVSRDPAACSRRAQALIHYAFRLFVWMMRVLGVLSLEVRERQRLRRGGLLVLANHPSLIDVVLLLSLLRQANCVVKSRLLKNPFTRPPILAAGYISNAEGSPLVDECIAALDRGETLLLFPEGTRTPPGGPIGLRRGAANIAVRARRAVTPVVIRVNTPTLTGRAGWYRVPRVRPHFVVEVKEDLAIDPFLAGNRPMPLAARELTARLQTFFTKEVEQIASV